MGFEQTFNRAGSLYLACNEKKTVLILNIINDISCGRVRERAMLSIMF